MLACRKRRRVRRLPWFPLAVLTVVVVTAICADFLASHSPYESMLELKLTPPFWQERGDFSYPLGTDTLGRDILSRIMYGMRISLVVGVVITLFAGVIGAALGILAGYFRGKWEGLLMRATDITLALPVILLGLIFAVALGPSTINVTIAVVAILWARFARLAYAETLSWRTRSFVSLAEVAGCSHWRIMRVHIFPNIMNTMVILASLQIGWVILVEASLSFIGAGIPPPNPTLGGMVAEGRMYVASAWWVPFFPGLAVFVLVLALNLLGDWLRDTLDPKLRQV